MKSKQCGPWPDLVAEEALAGRIPASLLSGGEGQAVGKDQGAEYYLVLCSFGVGGGRRWGCGGAGTPAMMRPACRQAPAKQGNGASPGS